MSRDDFELSTPRLRLRTPFVNDAAALQAIAADARVALMTASIPHPYPPGGALAFIQQIRNSAGPERRNLAITLAGKPTLIGMVGFVGAGDEAELAYMVAPWCWGNGYAAEAAVGLITYIFNQTPFMCVVAKARSDNPRSESVLRKAGLSWESESLLDLPLRGGAFPTSYWRLRRDDFFKLGYCLSAKRS